MPLQPHIIISFRFYFLLISFPGLKSWPCSADGLTGWWWINEKASLSGTAGLLCTCCRGKKKEASMMSAWFSTSWWPCRRVLIICGHALMGLWVGPREGPEKPIQQWVTWYWGTVNIIVWHELGARSGADFTHTCPTDDCSCSIMSVHRDGFNGI